MVETNIQEILSNPIYSTLIRSKIKNKDFQEKLKNFSGFYGESASHWAALGDRTLLLDILHELKLNPNHVDKFGKTPLDWIIERNIKIHTLETSSFQKRQACRKMSDDTAMTLWNYGGRHSGCEKEKIPHNLCGWVFTGNFSFCHLLLEQVFYNKKTQEKENSYSFLTGYNGMNVFHYLARTPADVRQDYVYNFIEEFSKIEFNFSESRNKENKGLFLKFLNREKNKPEESQTVINGFDFLNKKDNSGRTPLWHLVDSYLAMPENLTKQNVTWQERIAMYIKAGAIVDIKDSDRINCLSWCEEAENVSNTHKETVKKSILHPVPVEHLKSKMFEKKQGL